MRTATEWIELQCSNIPRPDSLEYKTMRDAVKEIQLDAWKQGMTDAAREVRSNPRYAGEHWLPEGIEELRDNARTV